MFSGLRRLLGLIKVTESGDLIKIEGLPADVISRDISRYWNTNKFNEFMFNSITPNSISFNRFFAPDFAYALTSLINDKKTKRNVRALRRVLNALLEHTWLKNTTIRHQNILNFSKLSQIKAKPKDHQMRFLQQYNDLVPKYSLKGYLLGAAPGSGKTLTFLMLGLCLETDVTIIVCPKNAIRKVWADSLIDEKLGLVHTPSYWTSLDNKPIHKGYKYYILHFDALDKPEIVKFFKSNGFRKPIIGLDESHNLNELTSARTQAFIEICTSTRCEHVIWSSGTLIKAIAKEVLPMLKTIDSFFTSDTEQRFSKIYSNNVNRATDILRNRLGLVTFQVDKDEIMGDIPKPITHSKLIKVPGGERFTLTAIRETMKKFIAEQINHYEKHMKDYVRRYEYILGIYEQTLRTKGLLWFSKVKEGEEEHYEEYKKYRKLAAKIRANYDPVAMKDDVNFCNQYERKTIIPHLPTKALRDEFKNIRSIYKYYPLKVQGEALGRVLGRLRVECNVELIRHARLEEQIDVVSKKTIIFTSFVEVVDEAYKTLKDTGYEPLRVYGDTNNDLVNIVNKYRDDPDANPLIATYKSLSAAVPLVMANQTIFANSPFRDYEHQQAISRMYRLGQDSQTYAWNLLLDTGDEPNISTRSNDILNWSREQVSAMLGKSIQVEGSSKISTESITDNLISLESAHIYCDEDLIDFVEGKEETHGIDHRPIWVQW